jgi:hypothetical protein
MSRLVGLLYMAGIAETKEEEKEKTEVPAHVTTFDPEKPPYQTLHLCIYLRELEEEKEKEELEKGADQALHK